MEIPLLDFVGVEGIGHYKQCFEFHILCQSLQSELNPLALFSAQTLHRLLFLLALLPQARQHARAGCHAYERAGLVVGQTELRDRLKKQLLL